MEGNNNNFVSFILKNLTHFLLCLEFNKKLLKITLPNVLNNYFTLFYV